MICKRYNIHIDGLMLKAFDEECINLGVTQSRLLVKIISNYFSSHGAINRHSFGNEKSDITRRISFNVTDGLEIKIQRECRSLSIKPSELIKIATIKYFSEHENNRRRNGETKGTPSREYGY